MHDMSDAHSTRSGDVRVTLRVPRELAARIDTLAAHCGHGRSEFIRTTIALADASMALAELRARERDGSLPPDAMQAQRAVRHRLAEIERELSPTPIT
jgi:metal-responsive CopG/Arc/MetJ family transcriptional regulator